MKIFASLIFMLVAITAQAEPMYKCWPKSGAAFISQKNIPGCLPYTAPLPAGVLMTDQVFAPTSFWYTAIPANAPLAANAPVLLKDLVTQIKGKYDTTNNAVTVNTYRFSSPVYIAQGWLQPAYGFKPSKVKWDNCQRFTWNDAVYAKQMAAVPIPVNAKPASGTDAEMTIYQPFTDTLYEMWKAKKSSTGQWSSCWGGKLENASKSNGIFPGSYGTTATGLPFIGGQVTADELARGEIKHAIGISLVNATVRTKFSWPAQRSDGNGKGLIAGGQRFRLDPSVNVDQLKMSKAGKTIAKAAQKYGFVVWDTAGTVSIRAQSPLSYPTDPYPVLYEKLPQHSVLNGFPWDKVKFLPMDYGKP